MCLKNQKWNVAGQVIFRDFCISFFSPSKVSISSTSVRCMLPWVLFYILISSSSDKKGLRKEQRGHFILFTIQWAQHFPKPLFLMRCLPSYTISALEFPGLLRRGQEMQWANQTTCKMLCDDAHLPGSPRKRWVNLSTGSSLTLLPWSSLTGGVCCPFQAIKRNK